MCIVIASLNPIHLFSWSLWAFGFLVLCKCMQPFVTRQNTSTIGLDSQGVCGGGDSSYSLWRNSTGYLCDTEQPLKNPCSCKLPQPNFSFHDSGINSHGYLLKWRSWDIRQKEIADSYLKQKGKSILRKIVKQLSSWLYISLKYF